MFGRACGEVAAKVDDGAGLTSAARSSERGAGSTRWVRRARDLAEGGMAGDQGAPARPDHGLRKECRRCSGRWRGGGGGAVAGRRAAPIRDGGTAGHADAAPRRSRPDRGSEAGRGGRRRALALATRATPICRGHDRGAATAHGTGGAVPDADTRRSSTSRRRPPRRVDRRPGAVGPKQYVGFCWSPWFSSEVLLGADRAR